MMEYKGYLASVEFDDEADIFHGEVVNIRDVVTAEPFPNSAKPFGARSRTTWRFAANAAKSRKSLARESLWSVSALSSIVLCPSQPPVNARV
jgi:hypothetical protein